MFTTVASRTTISWAMLRTARMAHLLGWAESSRAEAVIGAVPSAVCWIKWRRALQVEVESQLLIGA
jgi:hypothetical protein